MSSFIHIWDILRQKCETNHWTLLPHANLFPPSMHMPHSTYVEGGRWEARRVGDETIPVHDTGSNPCWSWLGVGPRLLRHHLQTNAVASSSCLSLWLWIIPLHFPHQSPITDDKQTQHCMFWLNLVLVARHKNDLHGP